MIRDDIVANALWGADHERDIHYSQADRWGGLHRPRLLPLSADCSSFVTLCYAWAGAPDPNGRGYDGVGFTGTLLAHLPTIPLDQAEPGDLIVYGPGSADHVVVIVEPGADPLTVSHGQERGPFRVRHSVEARAHAAPFRVLRGLDDPAPIPATGDDFDMPADPAVLAKMDANNALLQQVLNQFADQKVGVLKQMIDLQDEVRAIKDKLGA